MDVTDLQTMLATMYLDYLMTELETYGVIWDDIKAIDELDVPAFRLKFTIPKINTMSNPMYLGVMDMSDKESCITTIKTCINKCLELALDGVNIDIIEKAKANNVYLVRERGTWDDEKVAMVMCKRAYKALLKEMGGN